MGSWRALAGAIAGAGYLAYCYVLMQHWGQAPWAFAAMWMPVLAGVVFGAARQRAWASLAPALAGLLVLAAIARWARPEDMDRLYLLQHVGLHLGLALAFMPRGQAPRRSLIERLARSLHRHFPPEMSAYAHRVSAAWSGYFVLMAGVSLLLYATRPWAEWTVFANLLTPLAHGAFFVGEHLLRYTLHPEFERVTLADAMRAWRRDGDARTARP